MKAKLKTKLAKAGVAAASAASLACAFPTLAFASEEKEGIAVLIPDMNEFIPMLVAFIIILIVLAKFGWPVVDNIITKRESTIKEALKKSEEAQAEAERTLAEYKRQLGGSQGSVREDHRGCEGYGRGCQGRHHQQGPG